MSPAQQTDTKAIYGVNCVYNYKDTENNTCRAVNTVHNCVVPDAYKITSTMAMIGQGRNYPANNDPRTTLDTLCV